MEVQERSRSAMEYTCLLHTPEQSWANLPLFVFILYTYVNRSVPPPPLRPDLLVRNVAEATHDVGLLGLVAARHIEVDVLDLMLVRQELV